MTSSQHHYGQLHAVTSLMLILAVGCRNEQSPAATSGQSLPQSTVMETQIEQSRSERSGAEKPTESPFLFREISAKSGFDFVRNDDSHGQERLFEVNGGGAAVFDFDADGWLDIFMTNGCRVPLALQSRETPGRLFRNQQKMTFAQCSEVTGLMQYGYGTGCAAGDLNEDGFEDLYVTAFGPNQLWINNGDGTFTHSNGPEIPEIPEWSSSVAFADLNADGALDIYVANYVDESDTHPKLCRDSKPGIGDIGCSPSFFDGLCDRLLLSDNQGAFVDGSAAAGLQSLPGKGLGVTICDLGGDSVPEIYVANDGEANFLFRVNQNRESASEHVTENSAAPRSVTLSEQAIFSGVALNEQGFAQASMGVAAADLDRNGMTDIFLTHFFGETNTLYLNQSTESELVFLDATRASSLGPPSLTKLAFGVVPIDIDNNGWKDLLVANGHTNDRTWANHSREPYRMTPQVFMNEGHASYVDVSNASGDYFRRELLGRGMAMGDLDRDGLVDAVVSQKADPSVILRNESKSAGTALFLRLIGRQSCRTPVTARVTVKNIEPPLCEAIVGGGSFQSASVNEIHIGLGETRQADLEIVWPDGQHEVVDGVRPGYWIIRQGDQMAWPSAIRSP